MLHLLDPADGAAVAAQHHEFRYRMQAAHEKGAAKAPF
jgi:hypothetical protein